MFYRAMPNLLSFFRIVLTLCVLTALVYQRDILAIILLIFAGLTDLMDGYFARRWKSRTHLGLLIDPVADKFLVIILLGYFFGIGIVPGWYFFTVLARDLFQLIGMFILRFFGRPWLAEATLYGKLATAVNVASILLLILSQTYLWIETALLPLFFVLGSSFTVVAFGSYCQIWYGLFSGKLSGPDYSREG